MATNSSSRTGQQQQQQSQHAQEEVTPCQRHTRSLSDPKPASQPLSLAGHDSTDGPGGDTASWASGTLMKSKTGKLVKDGRNNGDSKSLHSGASPPQERKSKLSTLGKIFRPWKWKRKKKSEKFEKTAIEIERKISMRVSREELIRKGVIREPDTNTEQGTKMETPKEFEKDRMTQGGSYQIKDGSGPANIDTSAHVNSYSLSRPTIIGEQQTLTCPTTSSSKWLPPAANPVITLTSQTLVISPVGTSTVLTSASIQHDRSDQLPAKCPPSPVPPPKPAGHLPPPKSSQVLAELVSGPHIPSVTFQPVGGGLRHVPVVVPHQGDSDSEDDDDTELNTYMTDPDLIPAQSPYQAVLASEPDLNKRPQKSALKRFPLSGTDANLTATRPLDTNGDSSSPTPGSGSSLPTPIPPHSSRGQQPVHPGSTTGAARPVPRPRVTVQTMGDNDNNRENADQPPGVLVSQSPDYDSVPIGSDSDEEEDIRYRDDFDPNSLAAKVARNDSLAKFLESRPSKNELVAKNIIPSQTESEKRELREAIGSQLIRRLTLRPTQEELENRNILHQQTIDETKAEKERKKRYLIRKLSFRPSIEELRERKIIDFNDYVEVTDAYVYDRRADKPWTKLTPKDKAVIRKELNEFKSKEMDVHEESRHMTRFHKP